MLISDYLDICDPVPAVLSQKIFQRTFAEGHSTTTVILTCWSSK